MGRIKDMLSPTVNLKDFWDRAFKLEDLRLEEFEEIAIYTLDHVGTYRKSVGGEEKFLEMEGVREEINSLIDGWIEMGLNLDGPARENAERLFNELHKREQ